MQTYAIADGMCIKVGKSHNVSARLAQLQTGNPRPLMLIGTLEGNRESEVHALLESRCRRMAGEWFEDCSRSREVLIQLGFTHGFSHPRFNENVANANDETLYESHRDGLATGFQRGLAHALEAYSDDIQFAAHWQDYSWDHRVEEHW